jgi:hypothetical protein
MIAPLAAQFLISFVVLVVVGLVIFVLAVVWTGNGDYP